MEVVDANKKQRPGLIHPLYTTDFRLSEAGASIIDRRSTTKRYILRFSRVFSYTWDFRLAGMSVKCTERSSWVSYNNP
jgi:hypothetical protein